MAHPGDDGSLGPLLDRDAFRPGDGAAANRRGVIGHGLGQPVGEIGVIGMKGQERHDRPQEILDVLGLGLITASGVGFLLLGEASVDRSASSSARIRSMVAAGAQMPREKTFRPFFSATTQ